MIAEVWFLELVPVGTSYHARFRLDEGWNIKVAGPEVTLSREAHPDGRWDAVAPFRVHGVRYVCADTGPAGAELAEHDNAAAKADPPSEPPPQPRKGKR